MSDLTYQERLYAEAELHFARWIAGLGGWVFADTFTSGDGDAQVAANWIADGRAEYAVKDRAKVVELTPAGWAWCRENGAA
jgi:hypothetical protein